MQRTKEHMEIGNLPAHAKSDDRSWHTIRNLRYPWSKVYKTNNMANISLQDTLVNWDMDSWVWFEIQ